MDYRDDAKLDWEKKLGLKMSAVIFFCTPFLSVRKKRGLLSSEKSAAICTLVYIDSAQHWV